MDDEEKVIQEEEALKAKKRRQQEIEEQEEAEEALKAQRRTSRVEVDEGDEDASSQEQNNRKDDKKDQNNNDENNEDESKGENNDSAHNNNQDSGENNNNSAEQNNQSGQADKGKQDSNKSDSSQSNNSSSGSRNQNQGQKGNTSSKPSSGQSQNKPANSNQPKGVSANKGPQTGKGANLNGGAKANNVGSRVGVNASRTAASSSSAGGAKSASKIGKIIAKCGTGLIVVLIIIIVLGIIFFFLTMPGMVVGKIANAVDSFLTGVANFFDGSNANRRSVNREQVINAARYLDDMGYDLQGYGFLDDEKKDIVSAKEDTGFLDSLTSVFFDDGENSIDPTEISIEDFEETDYKERIEREKKAGRAGDDIKQVVLSKTWEEVKNKDDDEIKKSMIMMRGSGGEIEFVKSKYLYMYLVAANTTYLVRNDCVDFAGRLLKFIGDNPEAKENGIGLIYFTYPMTDTNGYTPKPKDYIDFGDNEDLKNNTEFERPESGITVFGRTLLAFSDRYKVDKGEKKLIIYNSDDGWFKSTFYTYNLGGWISQYGMPLQLSLALHLSTMAPDFAYKVAENAAIETRVEMGLIKIKGVTVKLRLMLDLDNDGKSEMYTVEKDLARHTLKTGDGDNDKEEGYKSETEANQHSEQENSTNTNSQKTCMEELNELEEEIKKAKEENGDKIVAGNLTWEFGADSNSLEDESADIYVGENTKVKGFCNGISSNYIISMQNILKNHGFANVDSGYFKTNSDKISSNEVNKVRKLIKDYFKLAPIEDIVYITTDTGTPNLNKEGKSIRNYIGDSNIIRDGQTHDYRYNTTTMGEQAIALGTGTDPSGSKAKETRISIWKRKLF